MAKTHRQLDVDRRQRFEERRKILMEFPQVYQRDFDAAFKKYLQRTSPEVDPDDRNVLVEPSIREGFLIGWPEEAQELSRRYNLVPVWDPYGDQAPEPVEEGAARYIRCQDERIWAKQITPDSIVNLPPHKVLGRFLLVEIDLSKPRREVEASLMAIVGQKRKRLEISGAHQELVNLPEPRNRETSYTYDKMAVWQMVEELRGEGGDDVKTILTRLAEEICKKQGWDTGYGDFKDDPETDERIKATRKALTNAYDRDKKLYFGE
jgi:hypothetical protein